MVAFLIEAGGEFQDLPGAKFDAIAATLASILNDINNPLGDLNPVRIQWYPPQLHRCYPLQS
jgi:hypothetical protein